MHRLATTARRSSPMAPLAGLRRGLLVAAASVALLPGLPAYGQEPASQDAAAGGTAGLVELAPVTWERLVHAADEPQNWLMYSGTLDSQRFSRLDQVDRTTVADLELKWAYSIRQL
ncbi:MAG: hypothetical protein OXH04_14215, partial [Acidobacteria bacterium]|nr:hypothetical protein [Acidobacteriota bacterium]